MTDEELRAIDARVAAEVMGFDLRGRACAVHVEGEWSVHPDSDPENWACYAGMEPVYKATNHRTQPDRAAHDKYWGKEGRDGISERMWESEVEEWNADQESFGCSRWDLEVVPCYSTDIRDAWEVVEKLADMLDRTLRECSSGWEFGGRKSDGTVVWGQADTAPLAICLAALEAVKP